MNAQEIVDAKKREHGLTEMAINQAACRRPALPRVDTDCRSKCPICKRTFVQGDVVGGRGSSTLGGAEPGQIAHIDCMARTPQPTGHPIQFPSSTAGQLIDRLEALDRAQDEAHACLLAALRQIVEILNLEIPKKA